MPTIYLNSGTGNDANDGLTKEAAKSTWQAAVTAAGNSGVVLVASTHREAPESFTALALPTSLENMVRLYSINWSTDALEFGAQYQPTGGYNASINGCGYFWGCQILSGTGSLRSANLCNGVGHQYQIYENCLVGHGPSGRTGGIAIGSAAPGAASSRKCTFINTDTILQSSGSTVFTVNCDFDWIGGDMTTNAPALGFQPGANRVAPVVRIVGVDLSIMAGLPLMDTNRQSEYKFIFDKCKIPSSVTMPTGLIAPMQSVEMHNSLDSAISYDARKYLWQGRQLTETTIVRSGGATTGVTPFAWNILTNSYASFFIPYEALSIHAQASAEETTITAHMITDNVALTNADCWLEVEYFGSASSPLSSVATSRPGILATPTNLPTSTETWTTTGLTTPVKQQVSVTFTPTIAGLYRARIMVARPNTTVYVCPKLEVS